MATTAIRATTATARARVTRRALREGAAKARWEVLDIGDAPLSKRLLSREL
jgi:hypothetical protein